MNTLRIYDISPLIHPGIGTWEGDTPFSYRQIQQLQRGDSTNLGSISSSLHIGAHMDAPRHFMDKGLTIETVPLERCIGSVHVLSRISDGVITSADLDKVLSMNPERILVKSCDARDPDQFPREFAHFDEEAALAIARAGVQLIGIDSPSVDWVHSKDLPVHNIFGGAAIVILENLLLNEVPEGEYELIALPLKISGADASPVRAVLRSGNS